MSFPDPSLRRLKQRIPRGVNDTASGQEEREKPIAQDAGPSSGALVVDTQATEVNRQTASDSGEVTASSRNAIAIGGGGTAAGEQESDHSQPKTNDIADAEVEALQSTAGDLSELPLGRPFSEKSVLEFVRDTLLPFSDKLDPFATLPVSLDRFQEHLVTFYLIYYPKVTYGLSSRLKPHPVATNFSIALTTPACFQVALARSALYRIGLQKYTTDKERKSLEIALMSHKGEAIKIVRQLSARSNPKHKDDLLASIISLGTLDRRTGASSTAGMHYMAVRRILKSTGGPLAVRSVLLSRVMCWFECVYGTTPESYIWDETDLEGLIAQVNNFTFRLWRLWKTYNKISSSHGSDSGNEADIDAQYSSCFLDPDSSLCQLTSRQSAVTNELSAQHRLELVCQLTCLLTLAAIILDHANDRALLQEYLDKLHKMVADLRLTSESSNNVLWQIQVQDQSEQHSKRIWRAASYAWVMKHITYNVQAMLKDWLLKFLTAQKTEKVFRLDRFHFSYAS